MNSLLGLLPIAIAGLIGIVVGLYYAKKERSETPKNRRATDKQASRAQAPASH